MAAITSSLVMFFSSLVMFFSSLVMFFSSLVMFFPCSVTFFSPIKKPPVWVAQFFKFFVVQTLWFRHLGPVEMFNLDFLAISAIGNRLQTHFDSSGFVTAGKREARG